MKAELDTTTGAHVSGITQCLSALSFMKTRIAAVQRWQNTLTNFETRADASTRKNILLRFEPTAEFENINSRDQRVRKDCLPERNRGEEYEVYAEPAQSSD